MANDKSIRVVIEMTRRCNLRCKGCFRESGLVDDTTDLPYERVQAILRWASKQKPLPTVTMFFAGEPFLYPDVHAAVGYANMLGLSYVMSTNGTICDWPLVDAMLQGSCKMLCVSLDGGEDETVRVMRGTDKGLGFLRTILRKRNEFSSKTTISASYLWSVQPLTDQQYFVKRWMDAGCDLVIVRRMLTDEASGISASPPCLFRDALEVKADGTIRLCERRAGSPVIGQASEINDEWQFKQTDAGERVFCRGCPQRFCGRGWEGKARLRGESDYPIMLSSPNSYWVREDYFNTIYSREAKAKGWIQDRLGEL
jgi:hypothetical protein